MLYVAAEMVRPERRGKNLKRGKEENSIVSVTKPLDCWYQLCLRDLQKKKFFAFRCCTLPLRDGFDEFVSKLQIHQML